MSVEQMLRDWHKEKTTRSFLVRPDDWFNEPEWQGYNVTLRDFGYTIGGFTYFRGEPFADIARRFEETKALLPEFQIDEPGRLA